MRHALLLLLIAFLALITVGMLRTMQTTPPVAFQLYSGNETLPPEYQQVTTIRGTIDVATMNLTYTFRDENGTIERTLTVEGHTYDTYMQLLRDTRITSVSAVNRPVGGGSFDVTLVAADGTSRTGTPSNQRAWEQFAQEIAQAASKP